MRTRTLLAASGLWALAGAASAQVTGIETSRRVGFTIENPNSPTSETSYSGAIQNGATQYFTDFYGFPNYANYQTSTEIDNSQGYISFADNTTTASNARGSTATTTTIQVTYKNPLSYPVNPELHSTIIPGGFGVYLGNLFGNPTFQGYSGANSAQAPLVGDINQTPEIPLVGSGFLGIAGAPYFSSDFVADIADTSFSFTILSGTTVVAQYQATLSIDLEPYGCSGCTPSVVPVLTTDFSTPLDDFGLIASDSGNQAVGYSWDATDISVPLGTLAAGASTTLTYVTSVTTDTQIGGETIGQVLMTYAGFGDPIGKMAGGGGIPDPHFNLLDLGLPSFDPATGDLSVGSFLGYGTTTPPTPRDLDLDGSQSVPEPDAWVLMLAGAGLAGGVLRARRSRLAP